MTRQGEARRVHSLRPAHARERARRTQRGEEKRRETLIRRARGESAFSGFVRL